MTGGSKSNSSWTEERIALLRLCFDKGMSASQTAALLGGVSRGSVCGKLSRLGLKREPAFTPSSRLPIGRPPQSIHRDKPLKAVKSALIAEDPTIVHALNRPWETRNPGECCYVVKTVGREHYSCCAPTFRLGPDWAYCAEHFAKMKAETQPARKIYAYDPTVLPNARRSA